jgi:perosamine synthetase
MALKEFTAWLEESLVTNKIIADVPHDEFSAYWRELGFVEKDEGSIFVHDHSALGEKMILTAGPTISSRETSYALDACRYGWNSEWATYLKKFETSFAQYIGVKYALTTSSCTGALHLAFAALEIGPGDEVIVPEITWVATASAVEYVGATPVFAEVDQNNWCLDPEKLEELITPKTKCIVPVHTYGHPCDMDKIVAIAKKHNLFVVEDAAPAIGAECRGRKTGSYGHFAAFSFQGAKMLVTGEGGMLVCNDPQLYEKAYRLWDHGRTAGTFWINEIGFKYKMSNIQAAIGCGQLERCEQQIKAKRNIANWYIDEFGDFEGATFWRESDWARSIYWMSSLTINPEWGVSRDAFFTELKKYKIDTRPAFPAISQYPMWSKPPKPIAKKIGDFGVNLPSGVKLKEHEVRYVAQKIKEILLGLKK